MGIPTEAYPTSHEIKICIRLKTSRQGNPNFIRRALTQSVYCPIPKKFGFEPSEGNSSFRDQRYHRYHGHEDVVVELTPRAPLRTAAGIFLG